MYNKKYATKTQGTQTTLVIKSRTPSKTGERVKSRDTDNIGEQVKNKQKEE